MSIAIIDADLIGRRKHRFPNLVCEKLSAFWKERGYEVILKLNYEALDQYEKVYIAKVFTDTPVPDWINRKVNMVTGESNLPKNIKVGGTGFFFDKAPNLPDEIEHHKPDYHLYDDWIEAEVLRAKQEAYQAGNYEFNETKFRVQFKEYTDYSIGFITRGCFRKCPFCVNQKYDNVFRHASLDEFYDERRKKICLLDDNFLGFKDWKSVLREVISKDRPFKFKQGIDERLLTREKCKLLFNTKYDGDYTFAFDNIKDYDLIQRKIKLIREYTDKVNIKFYVLVGFESVDLQDIRNMWLRVDLLMRYKCLPYIMRYQNKNETPWKTSKYRGLYIAMARWCNQPQFYKKKSFREYCQANQDNIKVKGKISSTMEAFHSFMKEDPEFAAKYVDNKFGEVFPED